MAIRAFGLSLLLIVSSACGPGKHADREAASEEMKTREIRKVTTVELMMGGEKLGKALLSKTEEDFREALMAAVRDKGIDDAISYCNLNASALVRKFEDSLGVIIRRVTDRPRNAMDTLSAFEKQVFEAYQFAPELATEQVQELDEKTLILNKPIRISSGLCLNCHGRVGAEVSKQNYELIKSLYPGDQATGYTVGELRGMWSVYIPKKAVINSL